MAEQKNDTGAKPAERKTSAAPSEAAGNTAVPHGGDHDRVSMLSLRADGSVDQHSPELIGDPELTLAATERQFREQAVSAVDSTERASRPGAVTLVGEADGGVREEPARSDPDPATAELKRKHDAAADAAESAARSAVDSLKSERG